MRATCDDVLGDGGGWQEKGEAPRAALVDSRGPASSDALDRPSAVHLKSAASPAVRFFRLLSFACLFALSQSRALRNNNNPLPTANNCTLQTTDVDCDHSCNHRRPCAVPFLRGGGGSNNNGNGNYSWDDLLRARCGQAKLTAARSLARVLPLRSAMCKLAARANSANISTSDATKLMARFLKNELCNPLAGLKLSSIGRGSVVSEFHEPYHTFGAKFNFCALVMVRATIRKWLQAAARPLVCKRSKG